MQSKTTHPLYTVWRSMIKRCYNQSENAWEMYGKRGITVCERWKNRTDGFFNFIKDMGERPPNTSIDRIDNNGNYEPGNCRWATKKQQQRNRRVNVFVEVAGIKYLAIELAEISGMKTDTIVARASKCMTLEELIDPKKRVFLAGLAIGGKANGARQKAKKHCPRGHAYSKKNTYVSKEGFRRCRACRRK